METRAHVRYDDAGAPSSEPATARRTRRALACALLVAGCATGVAAWLGARDTTVRTRESFGHGHLIYRDVETTTDPYLAAAAVAAPLAGVGVCALLLARPSRPATLVSATVFVVVLGAAAAVTYSWVKESQRLRFQPREYYDGPRDVAAAMARRDIGCGRIIEATIDSEYFSTALDCQIPAELAINDGFDNASIRTWASEDARDRWLGSRDPSDVNAVVGPTWMVMCEFESTCWEIQSKIGGLNN
jgi:hypothetical protein